MLFSNLEFNQQQQNRLRALPAPDEVHFGDPEQTLEADREAFLKAEIGFGWCPPKWLAEAEGLRWVQFDSVGIGEYAHLDKRFLDAEDCERAARASQRPLRRPGRSRGQGQPCRAAIAPAGWWRSPLMMARPAWGKATWPSLRHTFSWKS